MNTIDTPARSYTATWEDPRAFATAGRTLAGRAFLAAIIAGELPAPPAIRLLNLGFADLGEGRVIFTLEPAEYHYNPLGSVHGGVVSTFCDTAMGSAVHSLLPAGVGYTTLELKVSFLRPITVETGLVRCEGRVIHLGSRVATAEASVTDGEGRRYAHATTTCLIFGSERRSE